MINELCYRYCSKSELNDLKKSGFVKSKNNNYISLSSDKYWEGTNISSYDSIAIYDKQKIINSGGIEVKYDYEFMKENKHIYNHVTGGKYLSELIELDFLCDDLSISNIELFNNEIKNYSYEQEIIIEDIKYEHLINIVSI